MLDARRQRTTIDDSDWLRGSQDAPVTLLEYGDFECPYCGAAAPEIEAARLASGGTMRLVFRHFPISTIHPHARLAAEAAEAAGARGKFWEMHDLLFRYQDRLDLDSLVWRTEALGLDGPEVESELSSHVYRPRVRAQFRAGLRDGVNGTPTLFLDGVRYDGPRDRASLLAAVARRIGTEEHAP